MKSVAFYSYKGGSGRSTACVNFTYFFAKEVNATPINPLIVQLLEQHNCLKSFHINLIQSIVQMFL